MGVRGIITRLFPGSGTEVVIECRQCGATVDPETDTCPECGATGFCRYNIEE